MCLYPARHVLLYGYYCMQCFEFVLNIVKIGDLTLLTPLNPGAYLLLHLIPAENIFQRRR